ncbi:STAS domain-containing protein [Actinoplanes sp. M2I2]|uniref:STAS domain-containing protein n=1 Tax=Actinoplanes sp. M2I2 TaxID=1734444 RepID=UPI0020205878|nr:STAS domain-containing protein [Actinoplanes sp. M2I2]
MIVHTSAIADGTLLLAVTGEIDLATIDDFEEALTRAASADGTPRVVVDFSGVSFCDSSGLAALDRAYEKAALRGITLRVVKPQRGVRRLMEIAGMLDGLTRAEI